MVKTVTKPGSVSRKYTVSAWAAFFFFEQEMFQVAVFKTCLAKVSVLVCIYKKLFLPFKSGLGIKIDNVEQFNA